MSKPTGKVAVGTGAGAGLGAVYATHLAELGQRMTGRQAFGTCADASNPDDVARFASGVHE